MALWLHVKLECN